jgi:methionyl aminopeptidase
MVHLKSQREIERLRKSADLVGQTLAAVARHIRPGVATQELDSVAEDFIRTAGAKPAFKGYRVGNRVFPSALCISVNDAVVHGIPGDTVLKEGDLVSIDCGVEMDGYYGDSAYTFTVGSVGSDARRLLRTTHDALLKGIEQAVDGNRVGDIGAAVQQHCEAEGFGVVYELVGHGIGKSLHEEPQVPNIGTPGSGRKLKDGMTLCIEPMVNFGTARVRAEDDGWTVKTEDGSVSAHYEHMIVVRKDAPEILSTFTYIEDVVVPPYGVEVGYSEAAVQ